LNSKKFSLNSKKFSLNSKKFSLNAKKPWLNATGLWANASLDRLKCRSATGHMHSTRYNCLPLFAPKWYESGLHRYDVDGPSVMMTE
jgi:hypothetical protein